MIAFILVVLKHLERIKVTEKNDSEKEIVYL